VYTAVVIVFVHRRTVQYSLRPIIPNNIRTRYYNSNITVRVQISQRVRETVNSSDHHRTFKMFRSHRGTYYCRLIYCSYTVCTSLPLNIFAWEYNELQLFWVLRWKGFRGTTGREEYNIFEFIEKLRTGVFKNWKYWIIFKYLTAVTVLGLYIIIIVFFY